MASTPADAERAGLNPGWHLFRIPLPSVGTSPQRVYVYVPGMERVGPILALVGLFLPTTSPFSVWLWVVYLQLPFLWAHRPLNRWPLDGFMLAALAGISLSLPAGFSALGLAAFIRRPSRRTQRLYTGACAAGLLGWALILGSTVAYLLWHFASVGLVPGSPALQVQYSLQPTPFLAPFVLAVSGGVSGGSWLSLFSLVGWICAGVVARATRRTD